MQLILKPVTFKLTTFIRAEGFNTPPFRAIKKGIKPRMQPPYENNIPRPFRAGLLIVFLCCFLPGCVSIKEKEQEAQDPREREANQLRREGDRLAEAGDWTGAIDFYTKSIDSWELIAAEGDEETRLRANTWQKYIYSDRGNAWKKIGKFAEAEADFEWLKKHENKPYIHKPGDQGYTGYYELAALYADMGDYAKAINEMNTYLSLPEVTPGVSPYGVNTNEPQSAPDQAVYWRGLYYFRNGEYQKALEDFDIAVTTQSYPDVTELSIKSEPWLIMNEAAVKAEGSPRYIIIFLEDQFMDVINEAGAELSHTGKTFICPAGVYTFKKHFQTRETRKEIARERISRTTDKITYQVIPGSSWETIYHENFNFPAGKAYSVTAKEITVLEDP
jgi:tetratricopeptide (TPR) repeat protein